MHSVHVVARAWQPRPPVALGPSAGSVVTARCLFLQRFSSVVGPNGSGKSNVIDAMLFVFGKRAKQLRLNKVSLTRLPLRRAIPSLPCGASGAILTRGELGPTGIGADPQVRGVHEPALVQGVCALR